MAPRKNAGGLLQRILHRAFASETQQPHGKRNRQSAAGEQALPLLGPELPAERAHLGGSGMKEGWALGDDGLQLLLAALERPL